MLKHSVYNRMQNRRRSQRYPVGWRARATHPRGDSCEVQLADVSEHGIQFICRGRFRAGDQLELDVFTSWRSFFRSNGTIMRVGPRGFHGQEYGVRFDTMTDIDRAVLEAGLRSLRTAPFSEPVLLSA